MDGSGKEIVMYVETDMLKKGEYNDFIEFSKKYQKEFEAATVNSLLNAVKWTSVVSVVSYPTMIHDSFMIEKAKKIIREQQYRCLTMALYLDGLQQFLEG